MLITVILTPQCCVSRFGSVLVSTVRTNTEWGCAERHVVRPGISTTVAYIPSLLHSYSSVHPTSTHSICLPITHKGCAFPPSPASVTYSTGTHTSQLLLQEHPTRGLKYVRRLAHSADILGFVARRPSHAWYCLSVYPLLRFQTYNATDG